MSLITYNLVTRQGNEIRLSFLGVKGSSSRWYYIDDDNKLKSLVIFKTSSVRRLPKSGVFIYKKGTEYLPEILGGKVGEGVSLFFVSGLPNLKDKKIASDLETLLSYEGYSVKKRGERKIYFGNVLGNEDNVTGTVMIIKMSLTSLKYTSKNLTLEEGVDVSRQGESTRKRLGESIIRALGIGINGKIGKEYYKDWLVNKVRSSGDEIVYLKNALDFDDRTGIILSSGGFSVISLIDYLPSLSGSKDNIDEPVYASEKIKIYKVDDRVIELWKSSRNFLRENFAGKFLPIFSGFNEYVVKF